MPRQALVQVVFLCVNAEETSLVKCFYDVLFLLFHIVVLTHLLVCHNTQPPRCETASHQLPSQVSSSISATKANNLKVFVGCIHDVRI